ncbi:MAG: hypothetical protein FJW30_23720 [Acidobacteria bacterium]|nr:hypothetical protein [Acidobacteriota bacterium]
MSDGESSPIYEDSNGDVVIAMVPELGLEIEFGLELVDTIVLHRNPIGAKHSRCGKGHKGR